MGEFFFASFFLKINSFFFAQVLVVIPKKGEAEYKNSEFEFGVFGKKIIIS